MQRLLAPDVAFVAATVTLVFLFLLNGGASGLFRDSDAGWHIRNGERILSTFTLPVTDPFSFSKAGQPWMAWEWASDLLAGLVHRAFGLDGVATLYGTAIAVSVWMWFRLTWASAGNFLIACVFAVPMLSTANLHWLARPHVFGWLFLLGAVWFCECIPAGLSLAGVIGITAASAIWANMHGSFLLGPAVALLYAIGDGVSGLLWANRGPARSAVYVHAAAASLAGTLLNPHGWNLQRHVLSYLADSSLLDRIGEFQSFNFHADGAGWIVSSVLIGLVGGVVSLAVGRVDRFFLAVLMTAGALRSARMLPVAALILLPLAAGSITEALRTARGLRPTMRARLDAILRYGDNLRGLDRRFGGLALAPVLVVLLFASVNGRAAFPADQFPVAAAQAVAKLPADARIFAPDKFGGYLIYRFSGGRKVFFDGRSDFYGADFLKSYSRLVQARPGWEAEFAAWKFTNALVPPDYALTAALKSRGWVELYRDQTAVLLGPGGSR